MLKLIAYNKINRQLILLSFLNTDIRVNNDQITLGENVIFKVFESHQVNRIQFKNLLK